MGESVCNVAQILVCGHRSRDQWCCATTPGPGRPKCSLRMAERRGRRGAEEERVIIDACLFISLTANSAQRLD